MTICRFPDCQNETGGRDAVFCTDHHFDCTRQEVSFLLRMSISSRRAEKAEAREHLRHQLTGYVNVVVANIRERQDKKEASSAA